MKISVERTIAQTAYQAELPAELHSAVAARRLVAQAVAGWGLDEAVGYDGSLAVSELVTNSVLHAGTRIEVRITRLGSGLRIEVADGSGHLPGIEAARPEDLMANRSMTGRGLALVAATCDRWGCDPVEGGKVMWAEVATGRGFLRSVPDPARRAEAWAQGRIAGSDVNGSGRLVHLVGVPVSVLLESTRQLSDLQREVQVMAMGHNAPPELEPVVEAGQPWITDIDLWTDADRRMAEAAAAAGAQTIDFDVIVPDDIASRIDGIAAWLRRAASSIVRRQLLTLPASPEVTAYRRWYGDEVLRQVAGRKPRPCPIRVRALRGS